MALHNLVEWLYCVSTSEINYIFVDVLCVCVFTFIFLTPSSARSPTCRAGEILSPRAGRRIAHHHISERERGRERWQMCVLRLATSPCLCVYLRIPTKEFALSTPHSVFALWKKISSTNIYCIFPNRTLAHNFCAPVWSADERERETRN